MRIDRVEIRVVGPQVQRFTWSHDLPEQYMTNTVVRIFTDEGVEGVAGVSNYTSYAHDRYTAETLRHLVPALIGRDPLDREALWRSLWSRVFPLSGARGDCGGGSRRHERAHWRCDEHMGRRRDFMHE